MKPSHLLWKLAALCLLGTKLHAQELTLLGGLTTKENFGKSTYTWQVDYRQDFDRNFAGSIAYINEGHLPGHHRDGNAFELWGRLPLFDGNMAVSVGAGLYNFYDTQTLPGGASANTFFDERLSLGFGAGPYIYIDRKHPRAGNPKNPTTISPLVALTFAVHLSEHWLARLTWDRVASSYNRDSDVLPMGLGYRWSQAVRKFHSGHEPTARPRPSNA